MCIVLRIAVCYISNNIYYYNVTYCVGGIWCAQQGCQIEAKNHLKTQQSKNSLAFPKPWFVNKN